VPDARFCSACGAALAAAPPVTCSSCGTSHWRNPKPCANAIVVRDGRVLLTRRAHGPWQDAWCAPGGFCEHGEHPIATAEREVLEETGLRVEVTGYVGVWVDEYADAAGDPEADVINVGYYEAVAVDEGVAGFDPEEVSEVSWFSLDELPEPLAPPGTLETVLAAVRSGSPLPDRP
jgi:ADP-ribose pyrophosphatase YjhB (NUDIX family)